VEDVGQAEVLVLEGSVSKCLRGKGGRGWTHSAAAAALVTGMA
jgi:hypothetical protein